MKISSSLLGLLLVFASSVVMAEEVKVEGVHLCCGKCLTGAKNALTDIEGISKVRVNKSAETVVFEAKSQDAAKLGLKSLAEAGFYGKTEAQGPDFTIDASAKKSSVSITKMHLCCGGCINAADKAVKSVSGVESTTVDGKGGTISVTGSDISLASLLKALHGAGFHGDIK